MTQHERILRYLDKCEAAVSGQNGHATAFRVACRLLNGFALSEAETLRYMAGYNQKCQPPWSDRELKHKVEQAAKSKHSKQRGHLIGQGGKQPKPVKIVSAFQKITCQVMEETTSRTVRTISVKLLSEKKENQIIRIRVLEQPSESSEPLADPIPSGLCPLCWRHLGKFIPLNNSRECPACHWRAAA